MQILAGRIVFIAAIILFVAAFAAYGQTKPAVGKTLFYDSDGHLISNNEFVDIRMSNFHIKDSTLTRILPDGSVEFRLQKVPQEGMRMPEFTVQTLDGK